MIQEHFTWLRHSDWLSLANKLSNKAIIKDNMKLSLSKAWKKSLDVTKISLQPKCKCLHFFLSDFYLVSWLNILRAGFLSGIGTPEIRHFWSETRGSLQLARGTVWTWKCVIDRYQLLFWHKVKRNGNQTFRLPQSRIPRCRLRQRINCIQARPKHDFLIIDRYRATRLRELDLFCSPIILQNW